MDVRFSWSSNQIVNYSNQKILHLACLELSAISHGFPHKIGSKLWSCVALTHDQTMKVLEQSSEESQLGCLKGQDKLTVVIGMSYTLIFSNFTSQ